MKNLMIALSLSCVLILGLAACGMGEGVSTTPIPTAVGSKLDTSYDDALPSHLVLALGTLKLDGTANAVTPEQTKALLPLWQAVRSSVNTGGSNVDELNAVLTQIEGAMTNDQIGAINAMKLDTGAMRGWAIAQGLAMSTSPEVQATQQAQGRSSGGMAGKGVVALADAIVKYVESRQ